MSTDITTTGSPHVGVVTVIRRALPEQVAEVAVELLNQTQLAKLALLAREQASILAAVPLKNQQLAPIDTDEQEGAIVALMSRAYVLEKEAERLRTERVAPLNAEVKAINGLIRDAFNQTLAYFGKGGQGERIVSAYRRLKADRLRRAKEEADRKAMEAAQEQAEAERKASAAATAQDHAAAAAEMERASQNQMLAELAQPPSMPRSVKTEEGRATFSEVWEFEVIKPEDVPRQYLVPDERLIRAAVKAGARQIAGVNIFQAERMRRGV